MTETRLYELPAATTHATKTGGCFDDKKSSHIDQYDLEFTAFLKGVVLDSWDGDSSFVSDLLAMHSDTMNDFPGAALCSFDEPAGSMPFTRSAQEGEQGLAGFSSRPVVTTAGPSTSPAAAPATGAGARDDDDSTSTATVPMPHKRRRLAAADDDEVTSGDARGSPNDLVEVPRPAPVISAAAEAAPVPPAAGASARSPSPATPGPEPLKAVLVAKVLTRSDASSKRVILPRIAVEANLPQLAVAPAFNFVASDPTGRDWPLVVKAWANGQNPKPVYVLEAVGEMLREYKLGTGDAMGVLASQDGKFYVAWNTPEVRAAAARPTYSAFTFAAGAPAPVAEAPPAAPAAALPAAMPTLTAVPVTAAPLVPGAFIPTSPCELLVLGTLPCGLPTLSSPGGYLQEEGGAPAATAQPGSATPAAAPPASPAAPAQPLQLSDGAAAFHAGGTLLCPRTSGCTRPAGHQGWCLGHKGYRKRGRGGN